MQARAARTDVHGDRPPTFRARKQHRNCGGRVGTTSHLDPKLCYTSEVQVMPRAGWEWDNELLLSTIRPKRSRQLGEELPRELLSKPCFAGLDCVL